MRIQSESGGKEWSAVGLMVVGAEKIERRWWGDKVAVRRTDENHA